MITEIMHGIFISDLNTSYNSDIYGKYNISIVINCTENGIFNTKIKKKIRIPLSNVNNSNKDVLLIKKYINTILEFIKSEFLNNNILICCYDGLTISPLIVALFIMKYGNIDPCDIINIFQSKNDKISLDYDLEYLFN